MKTPRIYVACLASYNNSKLHGRWIDCDMGVEHVESEIQAMLAESPEKGAEEWAIHDSEGFAGYKVGSLDDISELCDLAEAIEEFGEPLYALLTEEVDAERAIYIMNDGFLGEYNSKEEYAEQYLDDTEQLSDFAKRYFDYEAFARDVEINGDVRFIEFNGSVFAFDNHI